MLEYTEATVSWIRALDEMERYARGVRTRRWVPPHGLGPLPAGLRDRAQAVLQAQAEALRQTADAMTAVQAQRAALVLPHRDTPAPVYVDRVG